MISVPTRVVRVFATGLESPVKIRRSRLGIPGRQRIVTWVEVRVVIHDVAERAAFVLPVLKEVCRQQEAGEEVSIRGRTHVLFVVRHVRRHDVKFDVRLVESHLR